MPEMSRRETDWASRHIGDNPYGGRQSLVAAPAPALRKGISESDFQAEVIRMAGQAGFAVYHTYDSRRSQPGFPDLVLVGNRVIFAELKAAGGQLMPSQKAWRDNLLAAGAEWYLWRPSDMDAIPSILGGAL